RPTAEALLGLQLRQSRWKAAIETLGCLRSLAEHDEERARLEEQAAELYEERLYNHEAAIVGYRQALGLHPGRLGSLEALEAIYRKLDRPDEILNILEQQLEAREKSEERVQILLKLADLQEGRFRRLAEADSLWAEALRLDSHNQE